MNLKHVNDIHAASGKKILFLSLFVGLYWIIGQYSNYNKFIVTGIISELLWLPMIAVLFILPVLAIYGWVLEKFSVRCYPFFSLLITLITLTIVFTS